MHSRILIATTTWWAMPARLALAFAQSGAHVSAVFPPGNPLAKVGSLQGRTRYSALSPLKSLKKAIVQTCPDLIVPCDDRVVGHLHQLYERSAGQDRDDAMCSLIERSLGKPSGYARAANRSDLLSLAERAGIRVPQTRPVQNLETLKSWLQHFGFPSVLKVDGTWGGSGVRVVHSWEEAERAFHELNQPTTVHAVLSHLSFHDYYAIFPWVRPGDRRMTVQSFIYGISANAMFACWEGEVLESLCVDVLYAQEKLGASTVVRTCANPEMLRAGQIIVKELGISGFCGLDFIMEAKTGNAYLIELNPRATQLGHLQPSGGRSLVQALQDRFTGHASPDTTAQVGETIAFFPQSLQRTANNTILAQSNVRYDVPWDEPALTRELMRRPWNTRHLSAWTFMGVQHVLSRLSPTGLRRPKKIATSDRRA